MEYITVDLFRDFKCAASACPNSCCKVWDINVDRQTYIKMIEKEKELGIAAKDWLIDHDDRITIKMKVNGQCPLLTKDDLCAIVLRLGPEYLCEECTQYPRNYMAYGNVVEESLYTSCPIVISKLMEKDTVGFIMGEDQLPPAEFSYKELYRFEAAVRAEIVMILQEMSDISLDVRLFVAFTILEAAVSMYQNDQMDIASFQKDIERYAQRSVLYALGPQLEQVVDETGRHRIFRQLLSVASTFTRYDRLAKLVRQAIQYFDEETIERYTADAQAFKRACLAGYRDFYTNYWVYCIFADTLSFPDYAGSKEKFVYIAIEFALFQVIAMVSFVKRGRLDREEYIYIISTLSRIMEHRSSFRKNLMEKMHESNLVSAAGVLMLTFI